MEYALLIYGDEKVWEDFSAADDRANMEGHQRFMAALARTGAMRGGAELTRTREATTLRRNGDRVSVSDGPYAESAEHLGGFYLIEAADLDAALELAKLLPEGVVEIRPVVQHGSDS